MSINAVKGVEIGDGFAAAAMSGEENADEMRMARTASRASSSTTPAASWAASRPARTSSPLGRQADLLDPRRRAAASTASATRSRLRTKGRHDPCVGIRATPVAEAMMACVLADHLLRHRAQCG